MILKMYTDYLLNDLKTNRKNNLDNYNNEHSFVKSLYDNYDLELYNLDKEVEFPNLDYTIATKENQKNQWEIDCNNSIKLHKEFIQKYDIGLDILSDERFITYLTRDVYYDYMRNRWPANGKENRVIQKYFLPSGSQGFTRNMFLRLFWYSYITYDEKLKDPYELTKVAFEFADPVNQIMERKYGRNEKIVKAALRAIKKVGSKELNQKRTIYGKRINNILSLYALDVLSSDELEILFENEIRGIIKTDIIDDTTVEEE